MTMHSLPIDTDTQAKQDDDDDLATFRYLVQANPGAVHALLRQPVPPSGTSCDIGSMKAYRHDTTTIVSVPCSRRRCRPKDGVATLFLLCFRWCLIDIPLALIFAMLLIMYSIQHVHDVYYRPLFDRARRTDHDLHDEYTYYNRICDAADLSTGTIRDLILSPNVTIEDAVHRMMQHGGLVFPTILQPETVLALRAYVAGRNANVSQAEIYPVSQGYQRLSFGLDGSEHPIVSQALHEIATHEQLRVIVAQLLGDHDPASAEITAITSYHGAYEQAWHTDTKPDGNALKFARTYSHSYSLFVPLQDTTEVMGITDLCPGTHYCANDLANLCEANKLGLHLVGTDHDKDHHAVPAFPAGYGALLNQHVWHRGGAHTDPYALERIVFIVSFLARPQFGVDPRQLSRGTYFHQKWNMWGHTWKDLIDPARSMRHPWSILRCLRLWKPIGSNWGYDLITSGFLRFSNGQLEDDDLLERVPYRLQQLHVPTWLQGQRLENVDQKQAWEFFIQDSINKITHFVQSICLVIHVIYAVFLVSVAIWASVINKSGLLVLRQASTRLMITHGSFIFVALYMLDQIRHSVWGQNILLGRTLARPFPRSDLVVNNNNDDDDDDVFVSTGPTTLPMRTDVLIGTRLDAPFLGSYEQWHDYHPGNRQFLHLVTQMGPHYPTYYMLGLDFEQAFVDWIISALEETDSRILQQDYRTGDWRVMTQQERTTAIIDELLVASHPIQRLLRQTTKRLVADGRFGILRHTVMARISHHQIWNLFQQLLRGGLDHGRRRRQQQQQQRQRQRHQQRQQKQTPVASTHSTGHMRGRFLLPMPSAYRYHDEKKQFVPLAMIPFRLPAEPIQDDDNIRVGSSVWAFFPDYGQWFPGTIVGMAVVDGDVNPGDSLVSRHNQEFAISFDDGSYEPFVKRYHIRKMLPIIEGMRTQGCFMSHLQDCYDATIHHVYPSGGVMLYFDDGDIHQMGPDQYYISPFRYARSV